MADPDTYNRITIKFSTPYARKGGAAQIWTLKSSLSGDAIGSQSDADATAMAMADCFIPLVTSQSSYVGYLYYPPGTNTNEYSNEYSVGTYPGTGAYYTGSRQEEQLEVVALCKAYAGRNSKGRAKYLFKFVHDIEANADAPGSLAAVTGTNPLADLSAGLGPHSLVTVDPTTGVASGDWSIDTPLHTRQLRRGQPGGS